MNDAIFVACLILHALKCGTSMAGLEGFIAIFQLKFGCNNVPRSWKALKSFVKKYIDDFSLLHSKTIYIETDQIVIFDVARQINLLLRNYKSVLLSYRDELKSGNGDILCNSETIMGHDPLHLHLLISVDGANPYWKKNVSFWPIQAVLIDLPPYIRSRWENIIMLAIIKSPSKPIWNLFMSEVLEFVNFGKEILIDCGSDCFSIVINLHSCVCDLPAQASFFNVTQFNGHFGCLFCKHPGESVVSGRGRATIYPPHTFDCISSEEYTMISHAAETSSANSIFGIKGLCALSGRMCIPDAVLIDGMHLLYENLTKMMLLAYFDPKHRSHSFYLGRKAMSEYLSKCILSTKVPHDMSKLPDLSKPSFWKAHDYKNFILYYAFPFFALSLPHKYSLHLVSFIVSCHFSNYVNANCYADKIKFVNDFFYKQMYNLYPETFCTINVHLLSHLSNQIRAYGALANYSMFSFESKNHTMKTYLKGTRGHLEQLTLKFSLYKTLCSYIHSIKTTDNAILQSAKDIIKLKSIKEKRTVLLDRFRLLKDNIVYHSVNYLHKANSVSYIVKFLYNESEMYGEIVKFSENDTGIFATIALYNIVNNLLDIDTALLSEEEAAICIYINQIFKSVVTSNINVDVAVSSILCRCIKLYIPNQDKQVVVPILSIFEHE